jgi:hypothetical protein
MSIKVRRGNEELAAEIINASVGGCLLRMPAPLEKGVALDVNIPMLNLAQARLYVLRCEPAPEGGGYMVATLHSVSFTLLSYCYYPLKQIR